MEMLILSTEDDIPLAVCLTLSHIITRYSHAFIYKRSETRSKTRFNGTRV